MVFRGWNVVDTVVSHASLTPPLQGHYCCRHRSFDINKHWFNYDVNQTPIKLRIIQISTARVRCINWQCYGSQYSPVRHKTTSVARCE